MNPQVDIFSSGLVWETFKVYLKDRIISFTSTRKRERGENMIGLEKKSKEIDMPYAIAPSQDLLSSLINCRYELNKVCLVEAESGLFQLRKDF